MCRAFRNSLIGLSVLMLLLPLGCSKGKTGPQFTDKDFIGTWIEEPPADSGVVNNPRYAKIARLDSNMRLLTVNQDGTFTLALADTSGNPVAGGKTMEGKWKYDNGDFSFEVTKNGLGDKLAPWKPNAVSGFIGGSDGKGSATGCTLIHENGEGVTYKRK